MCHRRQPVCSCHKFSFRSIFHWLDLLMAFYYRNRCWTEKKFAASIFDRLGWCEQINSTAFYFIYFRHIWKYCNDTQLMQITAPAPAPAPAPTPRFNDTPWLSTVFPREAKKLQKAKRWLVDLKQPAFLWSLSLKWRRSRLTASKLHALSPSYVTWVSGLSKGRGQGREDGKKGLTQTSLLACEQAHIWEHTRERQRANFKKGESDPSGGVWWRGANKVSLPWSL